jgi:hypothetical protein
MGHLQGSLYGTGRARGARGDRGIGELEGTGGPGGCRAPGRPERRDAGRRPGASPNFGFGIPGGIFGAIAEEGIGDRLWLSVEQGVHNGRMLDDALFGAARNMASGG